MNLTIGPHVVAVVCDADTSLALAREGKFGDFDLDKLQIRIRHDIAPSVWRETLCHETLHAAIALTHLAARLGEDGEEEFVRALSPYLAQVGLFAGVKPPKVV